LRVDFRRGRGLSEAEGAEKQHCNCRNKLLH
jgi:hypothetical protein